MQRILRDLIPIGKWIRLSHFFKHGPPNGDIAFDMIYDPAITAAIPIDLTRIKFVQHRAIDHERSRDRLFRNRICRMSKLRDAAGALSKDGASSISFLKSL